MIEPKLELNQIRTDFQKGALQESETGDDPIIFFEQWLQEALDARIAEPTAMALSTIDEDGQPHSRIVLLKGVESGGLLFFTNYKSAKGVQMAAHANVAALFFWKELERQVRIEGCVKQLPPEASDRYFNSRPLGSRISAIASPQSQVIPDRSVLENRVEELSGKREQEIIRPGHWGGYRIDPEYIEFWQGRHNRLHDRIAFRKGRSGVWEKYRLAP